MRRVFPLVVALTLALANIPVAHATADRDAVLDISFPVAGSVTFSDTYTHHRGGGSRRHQATDLFGHKGQSLHAAVSGRVCFASGVDEPMPAYGFVLHLCAGDLTFVYSHLNNDSPGTDDNANRPDLAYAPGIRAGAQVERGQLIGFMGDSGNAEDTPTHLHLGIHDVTFEDPALEDAPWRQHYRNPHPSLLAAQQRGDVPQMGLRLGGAGSLVAEWQADLNRVASAGLAVDGDFGPATDAATRAFQQATGLTVDGVVGPATRAAMADARQQLGLGAGTQGGSQGDATTTTVTGPSGQEGTADLPERLLRLEEPMMRGDDVRRWQRQLRALGVDGTDGPIVADGIYGPSTDAASRAFQQRRGLTVDGLIGPRSWGAAFAT